MVRLIDIFDKCGVDVQKYFWVVTDCVKMSQVNPIIYTRSLLCAACEESPSDGSAVPVAICFLQAYYQPLKKEGIVIFDQLESQIDKNGSVLDQTIEVGHAIKEEWILQQPEPVRILWSNELENIKKCVPPEEHSLISPKKELASKVKHYLTIPGTHKIGINNLYFSEEDAAILKQEIKAKKPWFYRPLWTQIKELQPIIGTLITVAVGAASYFLGKYS